MDYRMQTAVTDSLGHVVNNNRGFEMPEDFELSQEFKDAFDALEHSSKNIFVTGNPGTGKTTLLKYFRQNTKKKIVVLAPTGVAALNAGGQTIHSFFWFPHHYLQRKDIRSSAKVKSIIGSVDAIVLDEASMIRADLMDAIDLALRLNSGKDKPFGGKQILLFGDLCQLPPVVDRELETIMAKEYKSPYFFDAHVFDTARAFYIELTKHYRQTDAEFLDILGQIRNNSLTPEGLATLNSRISKGIVDGNPIILASTNKIAKCLNEANLEEIKSPEYRFSAEIEGRFYEASSYPAERTLIIKKGAQVMLLVNDRSGRWCNGTIGTVEEVSKARIKVRIDDKVHKVSKAEWKRIQYTYNSDTGAVEAEVTGSFRQYPLKLAWAITIHKSQGQTFDLIVLVLGVGAFAHGQTYVALSRCRTLNGIYLAGPIQQADIIFDDRIDGIKNKFRKFDKKTDMPWF